MSSSRPWMIPIRTSVKRRPSFSIGSTCRAATRHWKIGALIRNGRRCSVGSARAGAVSQARTRGALRRGRIRGRSEADASHPSGTPAQHHSGRRGTSGLAAARDSLPPLACYSSSRALSAACWDSLSFRLPCTSWVSCSLPRDSAGWLQMKTLLLMGVSLLVGASFGIQEPDRHWPSRGALGGNRAKAT